MWPKLASQHQWTDCRDSLPQTGCSDRTLRGEGVALVTAMRVSNDQSQHIEQFLQDNPNGHIYVASGFASTYGLAWLHRRTRHRTVTVVIGGSSLDGRYWTLCSDAEEKTAQEFLDRSNVSVRVWKGSRPASQLHAKLWITKSHARIDVLLGSANLTKSGLRTNCEAVTRARDEDLDRHWNAMFSYVEDSRDAKDDIRRLMRQREPPGGKTSRYRVARGANHRRPRRVPATSVDNSEVERSYGDANHHRPLRVPEPAITPRSAPTPAISWQRRPEPLLSTDPDPWQTIQVSESQLQPVPRRRTGRRWAAVLLAVVAALAAWWWMTGGISAQQSFSTAGRDNRPVPASVSADPLRELADKPCGQWTAADVSMSSRAPAGFDWGDRDGDGDGQPCETRTPDGIREVPCGQWTAADRSIAAVAPVGFDWGNRDSDGDGRPCEASAAGG